MAANLIYMTKTAWQALLNSIRTKAGLSSTLTASEAKDAVDSISSSIVPITNAGYFFYKGYRLNQLNDFKPMLSTVTEARYMFDSGYASTALDLNFMDVSGCANFTRMLAYNNWTDVDFSSWDTSSATSFDEMFRNCQALTKIDLSNFTFSADNAVSMKMMFMQGTNLEEVVLGPNCEYFGGGVTSSSNSPFMSCNKVRTLRIKRATPPTLVTTSALFRTGTTCPFTAIYVPAASVADYKAATNWSYFEDIIQADPEE